jgi:ferrous iron transport protein B
VISVAPAQQRVALAGNPNTGKTTLFNRLTGSHARVGNYPGVTVESETGELRLPGLGEVRLMDVPGTYSLSARSAEEHIAIQAIAGLSPMERPDAVVIVADATQLTRNLYLVLQVIEADLPVLVALNMVDMLAERGQTVDVPALARALGVPVVPICAQSGAGLEELRRSLGLLLEHPERGRPGPRWIASSAELREDVRSVAERLPNAWHGGEGQRRDALALWALLSLDEQDELRDAPRELRSLVQQRRRQAAAAGRDIESEIIQGRYAWIDGRAKEFLKEEPAAAPTRTDRVDRLLLNPIGGFAIFLLAMGLIFQSLFSGADPAIRVIEGLFNWMQATASAVLPAGIISEFVSNALIEGVGSVIVFLPQIMLLFLFIGLMEDSGYMARVAVLMDRLMKSIGLHGRAFVPMMSGFACAVPAILATRTMERQRDRLLTMMVIPLMTCSARLPVYSLLIGALFPPHSVFGFVPVQGLLMVGMYLFSTVTALVCAAVLGRTLFKGPRVPLLLEMPPYRMPHWPTVLRMMWRKSKLFLTEAGTVILAITVAMWLLLSFPKDRAVEQRFEGLRAQAASLPEPEGRARLEALAAQQSSEQLRGSLGGRVGHWIEPAIEPLGFDWKIGVGLLGAFAAREVFVSTMGVVYGIGENADESSTTLRQKIKAEARADGRPVYTPLVGLSLMIFFALACQCMSTLAVVRREMRTWRWPIFLFLYTGALAWLASFAVYQIGSLLAR